MIEELAAHFARAIDATPNPERAMNNLDRFIQGVGGRRFYYELLLDRPELAPRLAALFGASEYLSTYLATPPAPDRADLQRSQRPAPVAPTSCARPGRDPPRPRARGAPRRRELGLDALRLFHNRELVNVGLLDLSGKVSPSRRSTA